MVLFRGERKGRRGEEQGHDCSVSPKLAFSSSLCAQTLSPSLFPVPSVFFCGEAGQSLHLHQLSAGYAHRHEPGAVTRGWL
jgi:hypothetical protein